MGEETLEALKASIKHWKENANAKNVEGYGPSTFIKGKNK